MLKYETSRREQNNCKRKKGIRCEKKIAIQAYNENNTTQLTTEKQESIVKGRWDGIKEFPREKEHLRKLKIRWNAGAQYLNFKDGATEEKLFSEEWTHCMRKGLRGWGVPGI